MFDFYECYICFIKSKKQNTITFNFNTFILNNYQFGNIILT